MSCHSGQFVYSSIERCLSRSIHCLEYSIFSPFFVCLFFSFVTTVRTQTVFERSIVFKNILSLHIPSFISYFENFIFYCRLCTKVTYFRPTEMYVFNSFYFLLLSTALRLQNVVSSQFMLSWLARQNKYRIMQHYHGREH